jgi:hypothetical protein
MDINVPDQLIATRQIGFLDGLFESFIATNTFRGKNFTLEELLNTANDPFLRHFFYTQEQVGRTSIADIKTFKGHEFDWINIELPFSERDVIKSSATNFKYIQEATAPFFVRTRGSFNKFQNSVDILFYPTDDSKPALLISFVCRP